jgi:hypothetical protein
VYRHVSLDRCVVLFPASLLRVPVRLSIQFPVLIGTTGSYASSVSFALPLRSPLIGATRSHFLQAREMQRSFPSSWGILLNTCPGLETPVAPLDLALAVQQILPSAGLTASASTTTKDFGADFLTAHVLAVYASHPTGHPVEMARLAAGLPATALPGLDFHQQDSFERFPLLVFDSPFPKLCLAR